MKTDIQIQNDVMDELKWDPFLVSSEIGVAVKNGVVTLSGIVDTYAKKLTAEMATKRVAGVKAVAVDIQVGISPKYLKTDAEIAEAVLNALKWHSAVQEDKIKVQVENGNVKLEGVVDWEYQRTNARLAITNLTGVRSVTNLITVKPRIEVTDLQKKISAAFHRSATIDAGRIKTFINGSKVTLSGKVRSFAESEEAEDAVWAAPGVLTVDNQLEIEEPEYAY